MAICEFCGVTITMPYTCSYCNQRLCGDHKLPENHKCIYLDLVKGESEIFSIDEKNIFKGTKIRK